MQSKIVAQPAKILRITHAKTRSEGQGATVQRILGSDNPKYFDPFLMMDAFSSRLPGGFPDHPHRGFETVTYVKEGAFFHEDFKGHKGKLEEGDVQWMTAGKGIVHAEMPAYKDRDCKGFQLWINLKSSQKMIDPIYQEFKSTQFPVAQQDKVSAKVVCGTILGVTGPVVPHQPVEYCDITISANGKFQKAIQKGWNSFIYIYNGQLTVNGSKVDNHSAVFFAPGEDNTVVDFEAESQDVGFMWLSGLPIKEPIVQYGPFVMNTQQQIEQTFEDYQQAKNGFENVKSWASGIRKLAELNDE